MVSGDTGWELEVSSPAGGQPARTIQLPPRTILLAGRAEGVDVKLAGESVGHHHALLEWSEAGVVVFDLNSGQHTSLGGKRVTSDQPGRAPAGAILSLGAYRLKVQEGKPGGGSSRRPFELVAVAGCREGTRYVVLADQRVVLGRGLEAQLRLPDTVVSRRHLEITWQEKGLLVTDLGSTSGTLLDGQRLQQLVPTPLDLGKTIQIGTNVLRLEGLGFDGSAERTAVFDMSEFKPKGEQPKSPVRGPQARWSDFWSEGQPPPTQSETRPATRRLSGGSSEDGLAAAATRRVPRPRREAPPPPPEPAHSPTPPPGQLGGAADSMILSDDQSRAYLVQRELGRGGQGVVYQVQIHGDQRFDLFAQPVTTAVLKLSSDREAVLRERLVYSTPDRGVIKLLDTGKRQEGPYLALEKLVPHPLQWFGEGAASQPVDPATAVNIFVNLLHTVHRLHHRREMPLILCDIKPENVMLRMPVPEGELSQELYLRRIAECRYEPVLMDMGCAQHRQVLRESGGRLKVLIGTPAYLPPEAVPQQERGSGELRLGVYGDKVDSYALTMTFWELLTGRRPYAHKGVYRLKGEEFLQEVLALKRDRVKPIELRFLYDRFDHRAKIFEEVLEQGLHPAPRQRATPQALINLCRERFKIRRGAEEQPAHFDAVTEPPFIQTFFPDIDPANNIYLKAVRRRARATRSRKRPRPD